MLCVCWSVNCDIHICKTILLTESFILILYQVAEAEEKTAGGLLLTQATKEKPSVGTVSILGLIIYLIICWLWLLMFSSYEHISCSTEENLFKEYYLGLLWILVVGISSAFNMFWTSSGLVTAEYEVCLNKVSTVLLCLRTARKGNCVEKLQVLASNWCPLAVSCLCGLLQRFGGCY